MRCKCMHKLSVASVSVKSIEPGIIAQARSLSVWYVGIKAEIHISNSKSKQCLGLRGL